jgi:SPP1 family predicted phage head-tail adaptor
MKHYRHRIVIQRVVQANDEFGQPIETWSTLATVWGLVSPMSGSEGQQNGTTKAKSAYTVEIWYRSDLTTKDRISWSGLTMEINGIENVEERDRRMILDCVVTE